jgi:hypothetical protein
LLNLAILPSIGAVSRLGLDRHPLLGLGPGYQNTLLAAAALVLLPRAGGHVEAGHDLGLEPDLRGRVFAQLSPTIVAGSTWRLDLEVGLETWFRENARHETRVRLSPQQIRYPVSAHVRFPLDGGRAAWGLFAFHQSNHDVDVTDARLNTETLAYEIYGAEYLGKRWRAFAGLVYDRGTTLALERQNWPFEYTFATMGTTVRHPVWRVVDAGGSVVLAFHRDGGTQIPHLRLDGAVDVGATFTGSAGALRPFLRWQRFEDYQHLGDAPRQVLMLGLEIATSTPDG